MSNSSKNIFKNIAPAVVVMAAGLLGAFMVYDSYFSGRTEAGVYSEIAPAAGEEAVVVEETAEETAAPVEAAGIEFVSKAEESAEGAAEAAQDAANSAETAEDAAAAATEAAEKAEEAAEAVEEKTEEHKH